jgi:hypothetical protein
MHLTPALSAFKVLPVMAAMAVATLLPPAPVGAERLTGVGGEPPAGVTEPTGNRLPGGAQVRSPLGGGALPTPTPVPGPAFPHLSGIVADRPVLAENVSPALPDLKLQKFSVPISSDPSGTFYTVSVTVHNDGPGASGWVELRFTYQGKPTTLGVAAMPAWGSVTVNQTVWHGTGENCALELRVDPHNFEVEVNETNNYLLTSACSTY